MKSGNGKDDRYYDEGSTPKIAPKRWEETRTSAQEAVKRANELGGKRGGLRGTLSRPVIMLGTGMIAAIILLIGVYLVASPSSRPSGATNTGAATVTDSSPARPGNDQINAPAPPASGKASQGPSNGQSAIDSSQTATGSSTGSNTGLALENRSDQQQSWPVRIALVALSLALASLLGAILAFRPRKDVPSSLGTSHVAQIEILLAVLASSVVLVASSGIALAAAVVALGLFVRIAPAVRDSKESTVMLIAAAAGVACGAQRWEVALILTGLAFVILWVLEHPEPRKAETSIDVTVDTLNVQETNEVLREVFDRNHISAEFRRAERQSPDRPAALSQPVFTIVYQVKTSGYIGLDRLTDDIFSSDPENVVSVDWRQTKPQHQFEMSSNVL